MYSFSSRLYKTDYSSDIDNQDVAYQPSCQASLPILSVRHCEKYVWRRRHDRGVVSSDILPHI